jgi:hypothetical protein
MPDVARRTHESFGECPAGAPRFVQGHRPVMLDADSVIAEIFSKLPLAHKEGIWNCPLRGANFGWQVVQGMLGKELVTFGRGRGQRTHRKRRVR